MVQCASRVRGTKDTHYRHDYHPYLLSFSVARASPVMTEYKVIDLCV